MKNKEKEESFILTKNYVEMHTRLKAKQEPSFNLRKILALFQKIVYIRLSPDSHNTNKASSEFILAYAAAFLGGKGDFYAACDKGSHPSSVDQSPA